MPFPCPVVEPASDTQVADAVDDHVQSRVVATETVPEPPDGPKLVGEAVTVT